MKRFNWLLVALAVLCVSMVLLTGCVPRSAYDELQAEHTALVEENSNLQAEIEKVQSDLTDLQAAYDALVAEHEAINEELAEIKKVYPLRNFDSVEELIEWRESVGVLDFTALYQGCQKLQELALNDGYIVSVSTYWHQQDQIWYTCCLAVAGDSLYSFYPDNVEFIKKQREVG